MKKYISIAILFFIGLSACRKGEPLPEIEFFQLGNYVYDIMIDGEKYEKFHTVILKPYEYDVNFFTTLQFQNYDIEGFSNGKDRRALISYLDVYSEYGRFNGGLYADFTISTRWGFFGFSRDAEYVYLLPAYDYKTKRLNYPSYIFKCVESEDKFSRIQDSIQIDINNKTYDVYKMAVPVGFNCNRNEQHFIYVDKEIGIVRYEVYKSWTDSLIYRLDFNRYVPPS